MKRRMQLGCTSVIGLALHLSFRLQAAEPSPDWWQAKNELDARLQDGKTGMVALIKETQANQPQSAREAMTKVSLLMRAGMVQETIYALRELKGLCPQLENYGVTSMYYEAGDRLSMWDLAQAVLETFDECVSEAALENRLFKHWLASGWTVEQVDQWLAERAPGRNSFWVKERLRFNYEHGRGERLLPQLIAPVRENPEDIPQAIRFLEALIHARLSDQDKPNLAWMEEILKPRLASEAGDLASRLKTLHQWEVAIPFFQQAIAAPLTSEEVRQLGSRMQQTPSEKKLRARFAAHWRESLAECCLKLGRDDEAQAAMVAAADIREENQLGRNALLAGQVQSASGGRAIENRLKEEEKLSSTNPKYWLDRAHYYRGRNESAPEEAALKKGLELAPPNPKPERAFKREPDLRAQLLWNYAMFLDRQKRANEAVSLLRNELQHAPANAESADRAARLLAFEFETHVQPSDEVLWSWLEQRPQWEHTEERMLWRMLEKDSGKNISEHFVRAEKLTPGQDSSRACALGWIMNRMGFAQRSLPLLEAAYLESVGPEMKGKAAYALFESYRDTGDWNNAEAVFPRANQGDWSRCYSEIAIAAAQAGAKTDALRLWKKVVNVNPLETYPLRELARAGLREELMKFYRQLQHALPTSIVPLRAIKLLEGEPAAPGKAGRLPH